MNMNIKVNLNKSYDNSSKNTNIISGMSSKVKMQGKCA